MAIQFHLPGLRNNLPLNLLMVYMLESHPKYFREDIKISSFYGEFPTSLWNGGRFNSGDQCDSLYVTEVIKYVNAAGIPIRYTYTNPTLKESDLKDKYCNFCMESANNGMNEVLVVSPILEEYIRNKYPNFKINSSTCKEILDIDALNQELEKDYNLVVLDYNLNNKFDILENLNHKDKCELLVNACCIPNCTRRGEHYKHIARQQRISLLNRKQPATKKLPMPPKWKCEYGENNTLYVYKDYPTHISPDDIWEKYVPMGFNNFKIEGRTANIFTLLDTYCYYFAKPEYRDEARLVMTTSLEPQKILTLNRPQPGIWP